MAGVPMTPGPSSSDKLQVVSCNQLSPRVPRCEGGDKLPSLLLERIPNQGDQYLSDEGRKIYCAKHYKVYFKSFKNQSVPGS